MNNDFKFAETYEMDVLDAQQSFGIIEENKQCIHAYIREIIKQKF